MYAQTILLAAVLMPSALALPEAGSQLQGRAKVKLNQYASMDDCNSDHNILYHAAPVSGRCYDLDDKTHAFFWASGGMLNPRVYTNKGCTGTEDPLPVSGRCKDKGPYNSFKIW